MRADIRQHLPAALAFGTLGLFEYHRHALRLGHAEGLSRGCIAGYGDVRGDGYVLKGHALQRLALRRVVDMHNGGRFERGTDHLLGPLHLQRRRHHTARGTDLGPFRRQFRV